MAKVVFFFLYMFILLYGQFGRKVKKAASWEECKELCQDRQLRRRASTALLLGVMGLELILNLVNFGVNFTFTNITNYPHQTDYTASIIRYMKEREKDNPFYRAEVTHAKTLNDGALNSYNGISTFTSSANVATTEFMQCLGAAAYNSWNRYCYEESSPVSNLFLNLKYLVERDYATDGNAYFDVVLAENGLTLMENNAYLPLGFLADSALADLDFSTSNRSFAFQNRLFQDATGTKKNVWKALVTRDVSVTATEDVKLNQTNLSGYTSFSTGATGGTLTYTLTIPYEGYLCLDLNLGQNKNYTVWHNGQYLFSKNYSLSQLLGIDNVQVGDTVEVRVNCAVNQSSSSVNIRAAVLQEEIFREGYEILNASTLQLSQCTTSLIQGSIDCNREGLLYLSVPQDGNWAAYVDGEKAEIQLVGDCMIGLMLTEGRHDVELCYENTAFSLGARISGGCALIFTLFVITDLLIQRKNKKK